MFGDDYRSRRKAAKVEVILIDYIFPAVVFATIIGLIFLAIVWSVQIFAFLDVAVKGSR
jgi:hypothetical protein